MFKVPPEQYVANRVLPKDEHISSLFPNNCAIRTAIAIDDGEARVLVYQKSFSRSDGGEIRIRSQISTRFGLVHGRSS